MSFLDVIESQMVGPLSEGDGQTFGSDCSLGKTGEPPARDLRWADSGEEEREET